MKKIDWRHAVNGLGRSIAGFVLNLSLVAFAVAQSPIDGNSTWKGTLRFIQPDAREVACKITLPLKNFKVRNSFDCFDVWWLPPGRVFSLQGEVKPDGNLKSLELKWGHITYAQLTGSLNQASGEAGSRVMRMAVGDPGDVTVQLTLLPVGQQAKKAPENTPAVIGIHDGIYTGEKYCQGPVSVKVWLMQAKATVIGSYANVEFSTVQPTGGSNHYNFSQKLNEHSSVTFQTGLDLEWILDFSNDPPIARSNDGCEFELEKQGPNGSAASKSASDGAAKPVIEDGTYSGKVNCGPGFRLKLVINGFVAKTGLRVIAGSNNDYYSNSYNLKSLEPIRIPFIVPDGLGEGEVEIGLEDRHPTAVVHALRDCDLNLKKQGPSASTASDKFDDDDANGKGVKKSKIGTQIGIYDGIYAGKNYCKTDSFKEQEYEIESSVSAGRAKTKLTERFSDGADNTYNFDSVVDEAGTIQVELPYGSVVRLHFGENPPSFEGVERCKWPIKKIADAPVASGTAKSVTIEDGTYSGRKFCSYFDGRAFSYEIDLAIKESIATLELKIVWNAGDIYYDKSYDIKNVDVLHLAYGSSAEMVVRLKDRPLLADVHSNCKIELRKK
jgi:hypothetical protein